jgi:hypothetical protein
MGHHVQTGIAGCLPHRTKLTNAMKIWTRIVSAAASFLAVGLAYGEKVDAPGEAEQSSTHILTGTVTAVYSRITRDASHETGHYIAQVRVEGIEKGDGPKPGQLVYVRYWHNIKWLGPKGQVAIGPSGHQNIPDEGQRRRMCLSRNGDGLFDVYYVGGFKNAKDPDGKKP